MPSITVNEAIELATAALHLQGLPPEVVEETAHEFVSAELAGTKTHGLGKLISMTYGDPLANPEIKEIGSLLIVNGRRASGFVLFRTLADKLCDLVSRHGVALALATNFDKYSSLYPYCERVVHRGTFVALLANNSGPANVAPFGAIDPLTGTNPLCFSFPTEHGAHSIDFSTSAVVWGEVRQAALEDRPLPPGAFLDTDGKVTQDASAVNAVLPFGGAKGWALNLSLEILCGAVAGAKMGLAVNDEFDCGAFFLVVDVGTTQLSNEAPSIAEQISELLGQVRAARPAAHSRDVRAPGDRMRGRSLQPDELRLQLALPEATLSRLRLMAAGQWHSDLVSNPLFN